VCTSINCVVLTIINQFKLVRVNGINSRLVRVNGVNSSIGIWMLLIVSVSGCSCSIKNTCC
jgi:hypothetical protein